MTSFMDDLDPKRKLSMTWMSKMFHFSENRYREEIIGQVEKVDRRVDHDARKFGRFSQRKLFSSLQAKVRWFKLNLIVK